MFVVVTDELVPRKEDVNVVVEGNRTKRREQCYKMENIQEGEKENIKYTPVVETYKGFR